MLLSYVLRLVPSALADGRLAGTVQAVETGDTTAFRSAEELVNALLPTPREPSPGRTIDLREVQRLRPAGDGSDRRAAGPREGAGPGAELSSA